MSALENVKIEEMDLSSWGCGRLCSQISMGALQLKMIVSSGIKLQIQEAL